jgi:RNA polymerase sigma factor (sigma-70 family)
MQNWQKDRNYRKYENEDGSFTYTITIDEVAVEVSEEVFMAYSQADRRERYLVERDVGKLFSLERFADIGITLDHLLDEHGESAEDAVLKSMLAKQAIDILSQLPPKDQHLIHALVIDGITEQEYANTVGITQVAVHKRKKRILKNIFYLMVIKP